MDVKSARTIGLQKFAAGEYLQAFQLLRDFPIEEEDLDIMLALAWCYETGLGGLRDLSLACSYYERAEVLGSRDALHRMGKMLLANGEVSRAHAAFQKGASLGSPPCMCDLGLLLLDHKDDQGARSDGLQWLNKASESGHLYAKRKLLNIKYDNAPSIIEKARIKFSIFQIVILGIFQYIRDGNSETIA